MKTSGITRKIDELGRVVIPVEFRKKLGIGIKDDVEIHLEKSSIIIKKYNPSCIFCESSKNLIEFEDKLICEKCLEKIKNNATK